MAPFCLNATSCSASWGGVPSPTAGKSVTKGQTKSMP